MKDKKLQVFVSSTFTDLRLERQAAVEAILSSGNIPAGMELFSAGDESQMTVIKRWIDESDVFLLILAGRYGSIDEKSGKSYTHLEYEYALHKKKPLFAVIISDQALNDKVKRNGISAFEQINQTKLSQFRAIVLSSYIVKLWDDYKDITIAIHETLSNLSTRENLVGWIRGNNSINTVVVTEEIARLTKENFQLRKQIIVEGGDKSQVLYSNLTYLELENLLKNEGVFSNGIKINIFSLLINLGERLIAGFTPNTKTDKEMVEKMIKYRLIEFDAYHYKFTSDGHNFYLKALLVLTKLPLEI